VVRPRRLGFVAAPRVRGGNQAIFFYDADGLPTRAGSLTNRREAATGLLTRAVGGGTEGTANCQIDEWPNGITESRDRQSRNSHPIDTRSFVNACRGTLTFAFSLFTLSFQGEETEQAPLSPESQMQPLTKRQREILDYLNEFIQQHGYAPSLEEIGERFSLSSLATVHKHLTNLQEKGFIRRAWNRSRSVELLPSRSGGRAIELPMLGYVAAGMPIEAVTGNETISVPDSLVSGKRDTYVLRVKGESMIDEQIRDGDWVVVEDRKTADNGEMVIALVGGQDATLKKFYKEANRIRLQPANPAMQPIYVEPDALQIQGVVVGVMRKY
jgi:repressor LexA